MAFHYFSQAVLGVALLTIMALQWVVPDPEPMMGAAIVVGFGGMAFRQWLFEKGRAEG